MKKIILIIIEIFLLSFPVKSQNTIHNLEKYWYYRDRLEQNFMIVGSPELQGTNFPASLRHSGTRILGFGGENPVKGDFGLYLAVLATEYKLLTDYEQNSEAEETLQKIAWALYAFDRLDMNTEKFFRIRTEGGVNDNSENFWEVVDNYIHPVEDLNGFFRRGDADGFSHLDENPEDVNFDTLRVYPLINDENNILLYNNEQLLRDNLIYNPVSEHWQNIITHVGNLLREHSIQSKNKTVMSDDEVVGLFIGLVYIKKYVNSSQKFTDILGRQITIEQWTNNIFFRVMETIYNGGTWHMHNPVTGERIRPGDTKVNSLAYSLIAFKYFGYFFPTDYPALFQGHLGVSYEWGWRMAKYSGSYNNTLFLSSLADYVNPDFSNNHFGFFQYLYQTASDYFQISAYENLPLLYATMNNISVKNKWDDNLFDENYPFTVNDYKSDIENVLNAAPDCGPYKDCPDNIPNDYWFDDRFWPSSSKFIKIDREAALSDGKDENGNLKCWDNGYRNGLDYMLLHNLYWLQFKTSVNENVIVEQDFPFDSVWLEIIPPWEGGGYIRHIRTIGNHTYPKTIYSKNHISADNTIYSDGDVTYKAGESITLNTGFCVKSGAAFEAIINPYLAQPDYKYHYFKPECYFWNYFSKNNEYSYTPNTINYYKEENDSTYQQSNKDILTAIHIYPNPFNDFVSINSSTDYDIYLQIENLLGKTVFKSSLKAHNHIDLSFLSKGIYIFKITEKNNEITKKIIKQ